MTRSKGNDILRSVFKMLTIIISFQNIFTFEKYIAHLIRFKLSFSNHYYLNAIEIIAI